MRADTEDGRMLRKKKSESDKRYRENPKYIFNVGSPTIDYILDTPMITKEELAQKLEFKIRKINILFT